LEWNVRKFHEKLEEIKAAMDNYNEGIETPGGSDDPLNEVSEPI
jgi:hypothetical protein